VSRPPVPPGRVEELISLFAFRGRIIGATLAVASCAIATPASPAASAATAPLPTASPSAAPAPLYEPAGPGTHFINEDTKLAGFNDVPWYKANIPFLDIPDSSIEQVYYYRWRTWKEHLRYTGPSDGWISTEFLDCCGYAAPYQAINAAAGFHIAEGRWVRDQSYSDDYIRFWLQGPGQQPQNVNPDAPDWAHEYSFWAATAVLQHAEATGDVAGLRSLQAALVRQYRGWDNHFDPALGLYWQLPVWDAKEYSPAAYESSDHFAGVHTFRPSINAYQYGDALAIAQIARLNGDEATAAEYTGRAAALAADAHKWLWDPQRQFWYDIVDENNPAHQRLDTREETGFVPWQFDMTQPGDAAAWKQILDPQGFASPYGPATAERRSPWFMYEARSGCCHWDGPSWPYSTSQELTGLANQLDDYPAQNDITPADYVSLLHTFAVTQYRNGTPYVAEAHDPDQPNWIYDSYDHSEDYNHSSFDDLVVSGLIGLRPSLGDMLSIKPLAPPAWNYFALENVPYHGHNITVLYDRDGSRYHAGAGFSVYVDGQRVLHQDAAGDVSVPVGQTIPAPVSGLVNDAANPLQTGYPKPVTSYTSPYGGDDPWHPLDGKVWFNEVPESTRWTNYNSPNPQDYYGVDFGVPTPVSDVRFYGYDDSGGVRPAAGYTLQYWTGSAWADVPGQVHTPQQPAGNGLNRITFPAITTRAIRLMFTNPPGAYVGVTELQSWSTSSPDARVTAGPANSNGQVAVDGPTVVHVAVQNTTDHTLRNLATAVSVPDGWSAVATSPARAAALAPSATFVATYQVTPPSDARGSVSDLVATATYDDRGQAQSTHTRQPLLVACNATGPRVPGRLGNAVQLCGTGEYVRLPAGIVSGLNDFTISAWVNPAANSQWSRVFDFGTGTTVNMFLTVNSGSGLRFSITTGGSGSPEQQINYPGSLPLNTWSHVAVTLSGNTGTLYVDGNAVDTNPGITLRPSSLGETGQNWIGKSQYNDPYLNAKVDDFQIYDHALTAGQVTQLADGQPGAGNVACYRFDEDGGATAVDSSGNANNATIIEGQ